MEDVVRLDCLAGDALLQVFSSLQPGDLCRLQTTCRALAGVAQQETLWAAHCERWLQQQARLTGQPEGVSAADLLEASRLGSHQQLFRALLHLGSWPQGVWFLEHNSRQPVPPRGAVYFIRFSPSSASFELHSVHPRPFLPGHPPESAWECRREAGVELRAHPATGEAPHGQLYIATRLHHTLHVAHDGATLLWERTSSAGAQQQQQQQQATATLRLAPTTRPSYMAQWRLRDDMPATLRLRRALPALQALPVPADQPGLAVLWDLQGVHQAMYGPHGCEILALSTSTSAADVPPLCPITGPRLQAFKLRGDPNVPALKYSFVADAESWAPGPFNQDAVSEGEEEGGVNRPILAFFHGVALAADFERRPVRGCFRAVGQINRQPGSWHPEWEPATLVVYEPGRQARDPLLSMVFEDRGQPFRHLLDFYRFPFP